MAQVVTRNSLRELQCAAPRKQLPYCEEGGTQQLALPWICINAIDQCASLISNGQFNYENSTKIAKTGDRANWLLLKRDRAALYFGVANGTAYSGHARLSGNTSGKLT